jgi:hypothetical protein
MKTIAVDLDGTLAHYDGWVSAEHIGEPIPLMMARVKDWIELGHEVIIYTARAGNEYERHHVGRWLTKHGIGQLLITNVKHKRITEFWDDRAKGVQRNTGHLTYCGDQT